MKARIGKEARQNRLNKMLELRKEYLARLEAGEYVHVILQTGNRKTGTNCWTVSLIPIVDCHNCSECHKDCYDINNVCYIPQVQNDRARNSAIHLFDRELYWKQVEEEVKRSCVMQLRINVGGDLDLEDFKYVKRLGENCRKTDILFFTKSYEDINEFLDNNTFTSNVHPMISRWENVDCENRHNLPETHVLYPDGRTTAPEFGAKYCRGNCSECHFEGDGCWTLKNGESVIFKAH